MNKMNCKQTALFFGFPGLTMYLSYIFLLPVLLDKGLVMFWALFICTWTTIIFMAVVVLGKWKHSGEKFKSYFWFNKLSKKEWILVFVCTILVLLGEELLTSSRVFLSQHVFFQAPDFYPDLFKPNYVMELPLTTFLGIELPGNGTILWLWLIWLAVNIGCEELLWRGYALPRMEKTFGKWAWLVNGLLWNIVIHYFMRWSFISLLPISLVVPYLSQKTKSMWPGIIIHGVGNAMVYVVLIPSIYM